MVKLDALVKERVLKGIALLENKYGKEWVDRIDEMSTFDIRQSSHCVLGGVYGDYDQGLDALELDWKGAADCGFFTNRNDGEALEFVREVEGKSEEEFDPYTGYELVYDELQKEWCLQFQERQLSVPGCGS